MQTTLIETLCIERRLLPDDSKDATAALESAWQKISSNIASGNLNLIAWLDDALTEAHSAKLWIAPVIVRRLRQLQRHELVAVDDDGNDFDVPEHHGLPENFLACCFFMEWKKLKIVRRIGQGFEQLLDGTDVSEFVETASSAWRSRPSGTDYEIRSHIAQELAARGLEMR
ncbi:MAG TPA: hypothetical protein VGI16_11380 [Candidatus Acidoferrum sp.]|jgi:hypothetical protein